jgi:hypothetical protein
LGENKFLIAQGPNGPGQLAKPMQHLKKISQLIDKRFQLKLGEYIYDLYLVGPWVKGPIVTNQTFDTRNFEYKSEPS